MKFGYLTIAAICFYVANATSGTKDCRSTPGGHFVCVGDTVLFPVSAISWDTYHASTVSELVDKWETTFVRFSSERSTSAVLSEVYLTQGRLDRFAVGDKVDVFVPGSDQINVHEHPRTYEGVDSIEAGVIIGINPFLNQVLVGRNPINLESHFYEKVTAYGLDTKHKMQELRNGGLMRVSPVAHLLPPSDKDVCTVTFTVPRKTSAHAK
jgi:hypothetical protein